MEACTSVQGREQCEAAAGWESAGAESCGPRRNCGARLLPGLTPRYNAPQQTQRPLLQPGACPAKRVYQVSLVQPATVNAHEAEGRPSENETMLRQPYLNGRVELVRRRLPVRAAAHEVREDARNRHARAQAVHLRAVVARVAVAAPAVWHGGGVGLGQ